MKRPHPACDQFIVALLARLFPDGGDPHAPTRLSETWLYSVETGDGVKSIRILSSPAMDRASSEAVRIQAEETLADMLMAPGSHRATVFVPSTPEGRLVIRVREGD
jgi:hypothetical protein